MRTKARLIKRDGWPPGPWDYEPDYSEFTTDAGLPGILARNFAGAWCGYVAVPPGHPLHGADGETADDHVRTHGGVTYAESCQGDICHVPKPGEPDDVWWLGFDCGHYRDIQPLMLAHMISFGDPAIYDHATYRTMSWVRDAVEHLAAQLARITPAAA